MKFAIITHTEHKIKGNAIYAYEPYVREMNLWFKNVDEVTIIAPVSNECITSIESKYQFHNRNCEHSEAISSKKQIATSHASRNNEIIKLTQIPSIDIISFKNGIRAMFVIPIICYKIYKAMIWADHIHLRCPGNIGLLGCFVQVLFPKKPKTVKYAGNWDPKSKQPWSYRLQKWMLSNTFLTRNTKVLVYGEWQNQTKNILPFFTASYSEKELEDVVIEDVSVFKKQIATSKTSCNDRNECHPEQACTERSRSIEGFCNPINFLFVGALTKGKQPLLSVKVIHQLILKGYKVTLDIYGDGVERNSIESYIKKHQLEEVICLHGNKPKDIVKKAYKNAHFLLFISKSEGWPKVVAEAMFWACLPITTNVSCTPYMLDDGNRGAIVNPIESEIVFVIENYINSKEIYKLQVIRAMEWSRQFTLEKFEKEIGKLLLK